MCCFKDEFLESTIYCRLMFNVCHLAIFMTQKGRSKLTGQKCFFKSMNFTFAFEASSF